MKIAILLGLIGSVLPLFRQVLYPFSPVIAQGGACAGYILIGAFFLLLHLHQREARLQRAALSGLVAQVCAAGASAITCWWLANSDGNWSDFPERLARTQRVLGGLVARIGLCGFFGLLFSQDAGRHWNKLSGAIKTGVLAGGLGAVVSLVLMLCEFKGGILPMMCEKWGLAISDAVKITNILYLVPSASLVCFFALLYWKHPRGRDDLSQTL